MKQRRSTLREYFSRGKIPTEDQFAALIESSLNQLDDGVLKAADDDPLSIQAVGNDKGLLNFYRVEQGDDKLTWQLRQEAYTPGATPGLSIHDTDGPSRLFIEHGTGNIGIGTTTPDQSLTIKGGGIGFDHDSAGKKLYSPSDGALEWMTDDDAGEHAFAVSDKGLKRVYLATSGDSYFIGGNVGIGTDAPKATLHVNGGGRVEGQLTVTGGLTAGAGTDLKQETPVTATETHMGENYNYRYFRDSLGFVRLSGELPVSGNHKKLPDKYRPGRRELRSTIYRNGNNYSVIPVEVTSTGDIRCLLSQQPLKGTICLDGITFRAKKLLGPYR